MSPPAVPSLASAVLPSSRRSSSAGRCEAPIWRGSGRSRRGLLILRSTWSCCSPSVSGVTSRQGAGPAPPAAGNRSNRAPLAPLVAVYTDDTTSPAPRGFSALVALAPVRRGRLRRGRGDRRSIAECGPNARTIVVRLCVTSGASDIIAHIRHPAAPPRHPPREPSLPMGCPVRRARGAAHAGNTRDRGRELADRAEQRTPAVVKAALPARSEGPQRGSSAQVTSGAPRVSNGPVVGAVRLAKRVSTFCCAGRSPA
jgi:hypothetical protein